MPDDNGKDTEFRRIEWLDFPEELKPEENRLLRFVGSFGGGIWMLARPILLYVAIPCLFLLALVTVATVLPIHPLLGGLIFAVGLGLGLTFYYDHIVR
jgi:hypothetical protein